MEKKSATYKTLNEIRAAIASVSYCASEPGLSSNTRFLSQEPLYIQINVLKGGTEGFYFVTEKFLKLYTNNTDFFSFRWMRR